MLTRGRAHLTWMRGDRIRCFECWPRGCGPEERLERYKDNATVRLRQGVGDQEPNRESGR
jgi:hypothetical protein